MKEWQPLGDWLERQQRGYENWKKAFFVFLGLLVVLNCFILPHHPHFGLEGLPGFWAAFSLIAAVAMTLVLKKIVFPLISQSEDSHDRS